jgi:glycopeptide antibiotics resistance protein
MRLAGAFDLSFRGRDVIDAVRNVLLFAGWGAVWAATAPRDVAAGRVILAATGVGALISLSVESIQLFSIYRDTNIWDFATNTLGSALGAGVPSGMGRALERARTDRSYVGLPAFVFAGAYGAAVAIEALFPLLEPGMVPGYGGGVGTRLGRALEYFEWSTLGQLPLHHLPLFLPAGILGVAALAEGGWSHRRAWTQVAAWSLPLMAAVEVVAGVAGHPIVAGAVLVNASAVALGAWIGARWIPPFTLRFRGHQRPALLLAGYLAVLALWSWRPLTFVTSWGALADGISFEQFLPMLAHAQRFDLFSAADIARQFALLVPVGALLAVWPLHARGPLAGPLPGVALAALLEGGQILVDGRIFDITDVLVGAAAVLLGWAVVRQAAFPRRGTLLARGESARGATPSPSASRTPPP